MPEELKEQLPLLRKCWLPGDNHHFLAGYEADDLLGTLAKRSEEKGMDVTFFPVSRDLLQLASKKTLIRIPKTAKGQTLIESYHEDEVLEHYQVTPSQII